MNSKDAQTVKRPIINEKTVELVSLNKYTFEVATDANKVEIARAIEAMISSLYPKNKSKVVDVNTSAIRGRFRRSKRHGRAPHDSKKAIVTIEGDPLDIFSA